MKRDEMYFGNDGYYMPDGSEIVYYNWQDCKYGNEIFYGRNIALKDSRFNSLHAFRDSDIRALHQTNIYIPKNNKILEEREDRRGNPKKLTLSTLDYNDRGF